MAGADTIVFLILSFIGLLIIISAIHQYARNLIIPGVAIMMVLGAGSTLLSAAAGIEFEQVYDIIKERLSDLILLVIIPILIFESGRKLKLGKIRKEAVPIDLVFSKIKALDLFGCSTSKLNRLSMINIKWLSID